VAYAEQAAAAFSAVDDLRNSCLQLTSVGFALNEIGSYAAAEKALREAIAQARRLGLENAVSTAEAQLGRALLHLARFDEAEQTLLSAIAALRAQKNLRLEGVARSYRARLLLARDLLPQAEDEARRALATLQKTAPLRASANAVLASVLLMQRRVSEAEAAAKEANDTLEALGSLPTGEGLVRLLRVETLLSAGKRQEAAAAVRTAHAYIEARAKEINDERLRSAFLSAPERVRTRELHSELSNG
jgi:tetratricopeptide (TPR) repeat protein